MLLHQIDCRSVDCWDGQKIGAPSGADAFNGMSGNFLGFLSTAINLIDEFITAQIVIQRLSEVLDATAEDDPKLQKP